MVTTFGDKWHPCSYWPWPGLSYIVVTRILTKGHSQMGTHKRVLTNEYCQEENQPDTHKRLLANWYSQIGAHIWVLPRGEPNGYSQMGTRQKTPLSGVVQHDSPI